MPTLARCNFCQSQTYFLTGYIFLQDFQQIPTLVWLLFLFGTLRGNQVLGTNAYKALTCVKLNFFQGSNCQALPLSDPNHGQVKNLINLFFLNNADSDNWICNKCFCRCTKCNKEIIFNSDSHPSHFLPRSHGRAISITSAQWKVIETYALMGRISCFSESHVTTVKHWTCQEELIRTYTA